ncbi:MAG: DegT/DnrJ/EryC1/StrS family aminotransferase [Bacteroidales bacterium]
MQKIQMVDLQKQYSKISAEINANLAKVIDSCAFIHGPEVMQLETALQEFLKVKHVISCGNGTDALQISMMALGLKPGDEVITTDFTFVATAEVIALLGLTPVLVDVLPNTFNIDPEAISKAISPKTKAIVPVHLFGQCANMEEILNLAKKHHLWVIEDACQAIGAECIFKNGERFSAGTMGDIGCTSFFPSKNLGCYGDGGAIFTNDDELASHLKQIANHGMKIRYYHEEIGVNSRLDTIQAAVLNVKLKYLNAYNKARNQAANYYDQALAECKELILPNRSDFSTHVFHQYTLRCQNENQRAALQDHLKSKGIPSMVYYPVPLHLQKAYQNDRYPKDCFPITEKLSKSVLSLPMHTELGEEQLKFITESVKEFFN